MSCKKLSKIVVDETKTIFHQRFATVADIDVLITPVINFFNELPEQVGKNRSGL